MYTNEAIAHLSVRNPDRLDSEYLLRALQRADLAGGADRAAMGATLNKAKLKAVPFPLPPIEEQRRIAAVLDQADDLRAKRRASLALLHSLTGSLLGEIDEGFSSPPTKVCRLEAVGVVKGGLQVTPARAGNPVEVSYLRVANVHRGRLELAEVKSMRVTERELARTRLQRDDLLVVEGHGNAGEIGRVARWTGSSDPCVHQNHLIRVRLDSDLADSAFVEAVLNSRKGREALLKAARTTSGLNTISVEDVKGVVVALPSIETQRRFALQVKRRNEVAQSNQANLAELDKLFAALQHRAFAGEL